MSLRKSKIGVNLLSEVKACNFVECDVSVWGGGGGAESNEKSLSEWECVYLWTKTLPAGVLLS